MERMPSLGLDPSLGFMLEHGPALAVIGIRALLTYSRRATLEGLLDCSKRESFKQILIIHSSLVTEVRCSRTQPLTTQGC